jgi:hypothetical protein
LGSGSHIGYWKIGFVVVIYLYYLFVKPAHHERIKTNNRCCFYLNRFATVFAIGLAKMN